MSANASSNLTVFTISRTVLLAQEASNIIWATLSVLGLIIGTLQILTTVFWKPLHKVEQTLIFAIAIADWLKAAGFLPLVTRRLYETAVAGDDAGSQRSCMAWLILMRAPNCTGNALMVAISSERLLALAAPIWYKNRKLKFRLYLIGVSVAIGVSIAACMFIGASPTILLATCAFASSPVDAYRIFSQAYEDGFACLTLFLNLISCLILIVRWRKAVKAKQDMKTFKKNVHLSALKTLLLVVTVFLLSSAMSALWVTIINSAGWNDTIRMSYAPIGGCFGLLRGVVDFPCYVLMTKEYRNGFRAVILEKVCRRSSDTTDAAVIVAGASLTEPQNLRSVPTNCRKD